jgi:nitroreductase
VLAAKTNIDEALADEYVASVSQTRGIPVENLKGLGDMIKGSYAHKSPSERIEWAARQVYIALGVLVAAGASEGIDVAPMEGFDPKKFDEILGLTALNLESKVIAAVGFRAADDEQAHAKKVRFPKEEVVITIA